MTLAQIVSWLSLFVTVAFVVWRGSRPEKVGILVIAVGWVATTLAERPDSWYAPQYGMMAVDFLVLAAFIAMAFTYDRYWIICVTAFQAVAFLTHFLFLIDPRTLYRAYYFANVSIGYFILGALIGGVVIERSVPVRRTHRPSSTGAI